MANDLASNTTQNKVLRRFLDNFQSNQIATRTVNSQLLQGQITPQTGTVVKLKRPHQYRAVETTDGDLTSESPNDILSGTADGVVQNYITVEVQYSDLERAVQLDQIEEILDPVSEEMAQKLETNMLTFMNRQLALQIGTAGTAISAWGDVASCGSYLSSIGAPASGRRYALLNPFAAQALADTQAGLASGDNRLVNTAWEQAQISRNFGGLQAMMHNGLPQHTNGTHTGSLTLNATPTQTYVTAKDSYTRTIVIAGLGASVTDALTAGTVLQFTGRNFVNLKTRQAFNGPGGTTQLFQAVVTANADSDGSGLATVTISAPIFDGATGQYNNIDTALAATDVITVISGAADATVSPSIFYHENAVGIGTVKLENLHAQDTRRITENGFSIRMSMGSEIRANNNIVRFDMLPVFGVFSPLMGGRFYGTPS